MIELKRGTRAPTRGYENRLLSSKRSQVTIFIIIAVLIVTAILLFFLFLNNNNPINPPQPEPTDIEQYIQKCVKDEALKTIDILMEHGGDINPKGGVMYKGENITYLCYTSDYYSKCVNQRPMLVEYIETEITTNISPEVNNCFNLLKSELEKKSYIINMGNMKLATKLQPGRVVVDIDRDFSMDKNGENKKSETFKISFQSPIYELAKIANEIASQESKYCNFNDVGFMIIYPDYDITKFRTSDDNIIYTAGKINSNQKFVFAIRSCAMPGGLI